MFTIKQLSKQEIISIIKKAINIKQNNSKLINNNSIANIFIEPSTRTKISFEKAERELGMDVYNLDYDSSSLNKKESLYDTVCTLKSYGINNFIIRSNESEYWKNLLTINDIKIINAGDGSKNHPTQALLDAMTIYEQFKSLDNLTILISGDIVNSRVYHSFIQLMSNFNSKLIVSAPKELQKNDLKIKYVNFSEKLPIADVIIMLRIQHERHKNKYTQQNYNKKYGINNTNIKNMKKNAIVMHPGPINREIEIANDVSYDDPKIKILEQVKNGLYIRKVLLESL